jgi:hypothetical protein
MGDDRFLAEISFEVTGTLPWTGGENVIQMEERTEKAPNYPPPRNT